MIDLDLRPDCSACFGLCCVALPFAASADFAVDKEGGKPCQNLQDDFRCKIHAGLRGSGFKGCTVFECFGAGQKVSQHTYGGNDWRGDERAAREMFAVFPVMHQLHEMLFYVNSALELKETQAMQNELEVLLAETLRLTNLPASEIITVDVSAHRHKVGQVLTKVSELVRARVKNKGKAPKSRNLLGAKLKGVNFRGQDLRGALLIAADLRGADLSYAELLGADLRDTNLQGANLSGCLFLTQAQVNAAIGDTQTKLPKELNVPGHWEN